MVLPLLLAACQPETQFRSLVPEMALSPASPLDFGEVVVGETSTLDLYITNAGKADLSVTLSVDPEDVFSVPETAFIVAVDESHTVPIRFVPETFDPYTATLWLETSDPEQDLVPYAVLGTGRPVPVPDLSLCTDLIDFGTVAAGASTQFICLLSNTGEADLVLGAVIQSGSGAFSLATEPSGAIISAGSSLPVILTYAPATDAGDSGELRFPSNDADEAVAIVELTGNGGGSAVYPEAIISWGEPGTPPDQPCPATVAPIADLPLSGDNSTDPLGGGLTYLWTVSDAPTGAQGTFSDPALLSPTLRVDVAGDWSVQLQVEGTDGTLSAPALCLITAVPQEDIRVELSWDGPTSDLDLHLADGLGTSLYEVPGDVSPCNPAPEWGIAGPSNDPLLDQDDSDGLGPESIAVSDAADGTYPVRVHYFQRNADFSVTATVRVWLGGTLAFSGSTALDYNEVWDVGQINWPSATFGVTGGNPTVADTRQCN